MANHEKYAVGERVEMWCPHLRAGRPVTDWVAGKVAQADYRMLAVRFEIEVFTSNGWPVPERLLWCTHGSRHLRRPSGQDNMPGEASGVDAADAPVEDF